MPKVKVWNDNLPDRTWDGIRVEGTNKTLRETHPNGIVLKEMFKGNPIEIPAGAFIEMEFYEAHEFRGQYHPQPLDNNGMMMNDPRYFKMIRIEPLSTHGVSVPVTEAHVCMSCKHSSPSPEELEAHIKVRHHNADRLTLPEVDAVVAKNKGGRPSKKQADTLA